MGTTANKSSSVLEVWAYGVVTVIGGQLFAWNVGLVAGTISYGLGVFVIGMAYLCMVLSTAEVASVVAFRGGVYGLARCTLGFYFGFMVGCCELLEYSLFAASNSILVSQILSGLWPALLLGLLYVCRRHLHATWGHQCRHHRGCHERRLFNRVQHFRRHGTVLTLPSVLFTAATFALPASNILVAMAQSKLMPSKLATVHPRLHTNTNALLVIFAVSSVICPVFLYTELFSSIAYSMSLVFGLFSYSAQCAGFVYLRRHHHHMKRSFVNPVGIPGAVFAMIVFGLCMISVLFCQDDDYIVLIGTTAIVVVLAAHYHIYAKHRQTLSDDEHALFFAHVAKFNEKTKQSQATSTSASTWHFVGLFSTGHRVIRKIQVKPTSNSY
ncbi:unnamed protein product [Aphanomyces euteiches]|uniref:Amino acid permease/ SLC12A domain-containing protein n=1 Tax=Aphanomyces euteiches TaxID=100861 RepID=A0A6G0WT06_9STRA|nr:hypothetical protein Ae201684_012047 [Aphanomyces euteiches]KAH9056075.1 hypothetical protein Ae201684P_021814 [Aphanomyces euteiches]KAH9133120.1 hypothetical protein AeRB84_020732 [Aphanomyces euteiches]